MDSEFNQWNEIKKSVNGRNMPEDFFCYEREIWWCSIGKNVGVEANGKHDFFERPILILKVFNKEMIWILPITSTIKNSPFYYRFQFNNQKQSVVTTQIKTISPKRLRRKIGSISEADFLAITHILIKLIKTKPPHMRGNLGARRH